MRVRGVFSPAQREEREAARGRSPGAKMRLNGSLCCKKHTRGITRRAKAGPGALMGDERPGKDEHEQEHEHERRLVLVLVLVLCRSRTAERAGG